MIIKGRTIASEIIAEVRESLSGMESMPVLRAIVMRPSAATESYLSIKQERALEAGIYLELIRMENDATQEDVIHKIGLPGADSIIVQLPLPQEFDTQLILEAIPQDKDADLLTAAAREEGRLMHPVVGAIDAVLKKGGVDPKGRKAVVIGQGWLVGQPVAEWLKSAGADVSAVTKDEGDLPALCKEADIIVAGAGVAGLVKKEYVREGAAVIDVGTSELGGTIAGDVDPAVADVAGLFTPVPGGVGPITVACLMRNVAELVRMGRLQAPQNLV